MPASDTHPGGDAGHGGGPGTTRNDAEGSRLVRSLYDQLPEFVPTYLTLADACGDDPGGPLVLMELAEFVSRHLVAADTERSVLERALAVIETHLEFISDDGIGCELIAFAFFDSLSPYERDVLAPGLGPRSRELIDGLDLPGAQ